MPMCFTGIFNLLLGGEGCDDCGFCINPSSVVYAEFAKFYMLPEFERRLSLSSGDYLRLRVFVHSIDGATWCSGEFCLRLGAVDPEIW